MSSVTRTNVKLTSTLFKYNSVITQLENSYLVVKIIHDRLIMENFSASIKFSRIIQNKLQQMPVSHYHRLVTSQRDV